MESWFKVHFHKYICSRLGKTFCIKFAMLKKKKLVKVLQGNKIVAFGVVFFSEHKSAG